MCVLKAPVQKIERSYTYIIMFIVFNIFSLLTSFIVAFPICYKENKGNTFYRVLYILYYVFFGLMIIIYIILLCTNSLLEPKQTNRDAKDYFTDLIDKIIREQKNIKFNKICPICLIRKEYETKFKLRYKYT